MDDEQEDGILDNFTIYIFAFLLVLNIVYAVQNWKGVQYVMKQFFVFITVPSQIPVMVNDQGDLVYVVPEAKKDEFLGK